MGSDVVADTVIATNGDTTSSSARERIIQSVGVHLLWLVREYHRLLNKMEEEMNEEYLLMDRCFSMLDIICM